MEHTRTLEMKVGLAVGFGIFLFVLTILLLGGQNFLVSTYRLKVRFPSVQGLGPGSVVQMLGIPVGNVTEINVVHEENINHIEVDLKINREFQKKITKGSIAGVRTQGALGDKFIYITPGSPTAEPIRDNGLLDSESSGALLDTLAESGDKLEKVFHIIDEIHLLMKNINDNNRSANIMKNMTVATEGINRSSNHLASILEKIDSGKGTLGALINDRVVFERIKSFVGGPQEKFMKSVIRETIQGEGRSEKK